MRVEVPRVRATTSAPNTMCPATLEPTASGSAGEQAALPAPPLRVPTHPSLPGATLRAGLLVGSWFFLQLRPTRADNAISYKYVDYREDSDRMTVHSQYGLVDQDLGTDMHLRLQGVIDAIAGATPTGQPPATPNGQVPLTELHDRRKAWSLDFSRQFPRVSIDLGYANSRESDYVSNGWSLNTLTDFNEKNTTLLLGAAGTDDDVKVFYQPNWAKKRSFDFITGLTQLLDPLTTVTLNLGYGRSTGYLADPYRVVEQLTEVSPGAFLPLTYGENRPDFRDKWTLFGGWNRAFPQVHGAIEASYRLFHDSFGTTANTVEVSWFQNLGDHFILRPAVRFYDQTAADFYRIDVTGANFTPTGKPMPQGPFYSADYRLSALRTYTYGLKAIWKTSSAWSVDATVERYLMRGKDRITSPSAYPNATTLTGGIRFAW